MAVAKVQELSKKPLLLCLGHFAEQGSDASDLRVFVLSCCAPVGRSRGRSRAGRRSGGRCRGGRKQIGRYARRQRARRGVNRPGRRRARHDAALPRVRSCGRKRGGPSIAAWGRAGHGIVQVVRQGRLGLVARAGKEHLVHGIQEIRTRSKRAARESGSASHTQQQQPAESRANDLRVQCTDGGWRPSAARSGAADWPCSRARLRLDGDQGACAAAASGATRKGTGRPQESKQRAVRVGGRRPWGSSKAKATDEHVTAWLMDPAGHAELLFSASRQALEHVCSAFSSGSCLSCGTAFQRASSRGHRVVASSVMLLCASHPWP